MPIYLLSIYLFIFGGINRTEKKIWKYQLKKQEEGRTNKIGDSWKKLCFWAVHAWSVLEYLRQLLLSEDGTSVLHPLDRSVVVILICELYCHDFIVNKEGLLPTL